jgi:hypothetical protein
MTRMYAERLEVGAYPLLPANDNVHFQLPTYS